MDKNDFFLAIGLVFTLLFAIFGAGISVYGVCVTDEIWERLVCWFCSVLCLLGAVFIVFVIKIILS